MANLQLLKTELDSDPLTIGYSGMTDQQAADSLSDPVRDRDRADVPSPEILAAVTPAHYLQVFAPAGDETHRKYWEDIMSSETVDLDNPNIRTALTTIFAGKTSTLQALAALQSQSVSRATELGIGRVAAGTVAQARSL